MDLFILGFATCELATFIIIAKVCAGNALEAFGLTSFVMSGLWAFMVCLAAEEVMNTGVASWLTLVCFCIAMGHGLFGIAANWIVNTRRPMARYVRR